MSKAIAVVLVLACGCTGDDTAMPFVESPHELAPCSATWEPLTLKDQRCEAACDPKPALDPISCSAHDLSVPGSFPSPCQWTFEIDSPDGIQRGCCAIGGPNTEPSRIVFAVCD